MSGPEWQGNEIDRQQVEIIRPVLERYRQYWPLSPRQVYYQVVKEGGAGLWMDEFAGFAGTIRAGLIEGWFPLTSLMEDRDELREGGAWEDTEEFVHSEVESFLWGYRRDLMQGQERHIEVWVQKPGLVVLVGDVAVEF